MVARWRDVLDARATWAVECADVRDYLAQMPAGCVHVSAGSPPYWGLRDYKLDPSVWGGDPKCRHKWAKHLQPAANGIVHAGGMGGETLSESSATHKPKLSAFCCCGAWRGCLGLCWAVAGVTSWSSPCLMRHLQDERYHY